MKKTSLLREPARIREVKPLDGFNVELLFADGFSKRVNLRKYLRGPAFKQMRSDPAYFRQVFIDPIGETIAWPNTADIDADVLRYDLTPSWMDKSARQKPTRKNGARAAAKESLQAKRVYLYPYQVKKLARIDENLSVAIRQVVDTLK